jgi:hypothetical protein
MINELIIRQNRILETTATPGWSEEIVPALEKQIAKLEAEILEAGDNELTEEDTRRARRERQFLKKLLKTPDDLVKELSAAQGLRQKR